MVRCNMSRHSPGRTIRHRIDSINHIPAHYNVRYRIGLYYILRHHNRRDNNSPYHNARYYPVLNGSPSNDHSSADPGLSADMRGATVDSSDLPGLGRAGGTGQGVSFPGPSRSNKGSFPKNIMAPFLPQPCDHPSRPFIASHAPAIDPGRLQPACSRRHPSGEGQEDGEEGAGG